MANESPVERDGIKTPTINLNLLVRGRCFHIQIPLVFPTLFIASRQIYNINLRKQNIRNYMWFLPQLFFKNEGKAAPCIQTHILFNFLHQNLIRSFTFIQQIILADTAYDAALLRLETSQSYEIGRFPACMPTQPSEDFVDEIVVVSGFGRVDFDGAYISKGFR